MFTGIIEEMGIVKSIKSKVITIEANKIFDDLKLGDSVAVNGTCLTVSSFSNKIFNADITSETLSRTNLGDLKSGFKVNLERALTLNGRLGGHIVSGHIDGVGIVKNISEKYEDIELVIEVPTNLMKYIIEKGSVAVDGISLTIAKVDNNKNNFSVAIIPHTLKETVLYYKKAGDKVNIENDIIGKYVERLLSFNDFNFNNETNNKENRYMKNVYVFDIPEEIKKAKISDIYIEYKERFNVITYLNDFIKNYGKKESLKGLYLHGNFVWGAAYRFWLDCEYVFYRICF